MRSVTDIVIQNGERDGKEYGWGNNRGLVLMKSWDLIHWKRTNLRFDKLSAAYSEVGCAWAPEVTYDDKKRKVDDVFHHAL